MIKEHLKIIQLHHTIEKYTYIYIYFSHGSNGPNDWSVSHKQVSFKKEVVVRVNDLVFWLTVWLNFENVLLTFKWYVFVWLKCSM